MLETLRVRYMFRSVWPFNTGSFAEKLWAGDKNSEFAAT